MGPSTMPATGQRNKREGFERPARGHESLDGCPRTGPGEQRGCCPWRGPPCRWVRPCDKAEVWHCVFGKCEHGSREFVLPAMTQNTGDFDRDGREIQNTEVRERRRLGKRFRGGRGGGCHASTRPEWVASACVCSDCHLQGLCNFRKYVSGEIVQLSCFGEPEASHSHSSFGDNTEGSGSRPKYFLGFLSQESTGCDSS